MCKLEGLKSKLTECLEDLPGLLTSVTLFFFFFFSLPISTYLLQRSQELLTVKRLLC